ncbi:hypothetical protein AAZX31_02G159800 [Glycine max]|uniref:Uncharacterized protein n=1 Tax=Glycine soja TaxID=3848 RepID=A0A0B2NWZ7_GLYSO|nr:hypothetical protein JHK87_004252 [Glycine soja]KAG5080353.1 hypothetical protein JHK86_004418 [Glycine max]KAH1060732.1 hypothetical protein GYH30_004270 [Glycine max]KHN00022.1 hypothetical protein glysoja_034233 [Glycine soja]
MFFDPNTQTPLPSRCPLPVSLPLASTSLSFVRRSSSLAATRLRLLLPTHHSPSRLCISLLFDQERERDTEPPLMPKWEVVVSMIRSMDMVVQIFCVDWWMPW